MKSKEKLKICFRLKKTRDMTTNCNIQPWTFKDHYWDNWQSSAWSMDLRVIFNQCSVPDFGDFIDVIPQLLQCTKLCFPKIYMLKPQTPM